MVNLCFFTQTFNDISLQIDYKRKIKAILMALGVWGGRRRVSPPPPGLKGIVLPFKSLLSYFLFSFGFIFKSFFGSRGLSLEPRSKCSQLKTLDINRSNVV